MKPIVLQDCSKISKEKFKGLNKLLGDLKKSKGVEDDNEDREIIELLEEFNGYPQKIIIRNIGIYFSRGRNEYRTDRLVGILHIRNKAGNIIGEEKLYWCVQPRWGNVVSMLETVLESDESIDEKIYSFLKPKIMRWEEWKDYADEGKGLTGKNSD